VGLFGFRRSVNILPEIRWNFGKGSPSVSFYWRGFHHAVGSGGSRITMGIPDTGIAYTSIWRSSQAKRINRWAAKQRKMARVEFPDREPDEPDATERQINYIRSMATVDGRVLARLGRRQASTTIRSMKKERALLAEEKVHEYAVHQKKGRCGWLSLAVILITVGAVVAWMEHTPRVTNPLEPERSSQSPQPSAAPLTSPIPVRPATVEEMEQEAVRRYPDLGVAGTRMNSEFVARYKQYKKENSGYFDDPNWPLTLAKETADAIEGAGSFMPTPLPTPLTGTSN